MKKPLLLTLLIAIMNTLAFAQIITKEDSLSAGLMASKSATVLSGYGSMQYSNNLTTKEASTNVDRLVLFVGHKFNSKIAFFSELELEDVKVVGGAPGGEFALEQAFIKFDIDRNNYIGAGLIIPRIGIINENHLPTTFNGNFRPNVERYIIPATWREIGISYYGTSTKVPGLNYSVALINGLNSANFSSDKGIRGGRFKGANANANCLAITAALLYYKNNFRVQVSGYFSGSNTMSKFHSDSLGIAKNVLGAPVALLECNVQYKHKGFQMKALGTLININDAEKLNAFYGDNIAQNIVGYYGEIGYNFNYKRDKAFILFSRYENLNMSATLPNNAVEIKANNLQFITSGFTYLPHPGVCIKLDHSYRLNGESAVQHSINLGLAYSY